MLINQFQLKPVQSNVQIQLFTDKIKHSLTQSVFSRECPCLWQEHQQLSNVEILHFSLTHPQHCSGTAYTCTINLYSEQHRRIAKHIIRQMLYNHFRNTQIVTFDKINNVEVWVKSNTQPTPNCTEYARFSLIPQYAVFTQGWELTVSFNGFSTVYNKPLSQLDISTERFHVVVDGEVARYKHLTPNQKQHIDHAYPKINRELASLFNISEKRYRNTSKYTSTYQHINNFVSQYLHTDDFKAIFQLSDTMLVAPQQCIQQVEKDANLLQFKDEQTGIDPYGCVFGSKATNALGIYQPSNKKQVKFFFIYQDSDKDVCCSLYDIFKDGYKPFTNNQTGEITYGFQPLASCIKQPFNTDPNGSISFSKPEKALTEITQQLNAKKLNSQTQYVAIYISPISRDNVNSPFHNLYYQIKELLLQKEITSQVIYKDRPSLANFKYHLPNIAIAILAKIGGIPWQLSNNSNNTDLVIGVGAFLSTKIGERYVGSAFCFNTNGLFRNFDCCKANNLEGIVAGIRNAISNFVRNNDHTPPQRLIIHYYKTMSIREARPITQMLHSLGFNIPVLIVTINKTETNDIVMFDTEQQDYMPISGTILNIRNNDFLLYNNSRYSKNEKCDTLFPIRIRLSKIHNNTHNEIPQSEASHLINQVYQFSRMYWKSIKQQNLPITIKYPEMVAEIVPHFKDAELPPFGKNNLWFL